MRYLITCAILLSSSLALLSGCTTAPRSEEAKENLLESSEDVMKKLNMEDPSLRRFMDKSYGYVVFPTVGKAGLIAGGSYGRGVVYEQGQFIGYADISQATVGLQAGGQSFTELVVFETQRDLERFKSGKLTFAANVSAVILKTGAADSARYTDGVAVFVDPIAGAMVEAAVGGQQFTFQPK